MITDFEKNRVVKMMYSTACGYRNMKKREELKWLVGMEDRHFRDVCAEIDEIITCTHGYYILPLTDPTGEETRIANEIINGQDRRRMIALYLRQRKRRQAIRRMKEKLTQLELAM